LTKKGVDKAILKVLSSSSRPICTKELADQINVAWHTCERYLLRLQIQQKVDFFTIGKTQAWQLKRNKYGSP